MKTETERRKHIERIDALVTALGRARSKTREKEIRRQIAAENKAFMKGSKATAAEGRLLYAKMVADGRI